MIGSPRRSAKSLPPTPSPAPDPDHPSRERWLLAALLAWALGVRLWFAATGLDAGRFVDERYILDNVRSFLATGSLRPVHLYYPGLGNLLHSLLLGAADALARWTGRGGEAILRADGQFTPTAYLLSRGLQACAGVLTLYWTYRIGRRLLSPRAGLLAALILAAVPLHVRQSVVVKPDILMLLGLLIATEATLAALASGRLRQLLGAGAAVGLATSGKYNGVAAALPLALFALPRARREPAILVRLAAAGAAALLVFVLINPFFFSMLDRFQRDFSNTLEHYERKSADEPAPTHLGVFLATGPEMLAPNFHGLFTGLLGFAGLLFLLAQAWRRRNEGLALLTAFPLVYMVLYAASTTYAKTNNYLPVCPYLALGAAALADEAWRRARGPAARRVLAMALAVWCATLIWRPMAYTYVQTVPATLDLAEDALAERLGELPSLRVLYQVGATDRAVWVGEGGARALVRNFERIDQTTARDLDLADVEIYTPAALASPSAAGRLAAGQALRMEPGFFRARGEPLTLVLHPWPPAGDPVELEMQPPAEPGGAWSGKLPSGLRLPAFASCEVIVAAGADAPEAVVAGARRLELFPGGRRDRRWLTERFRFEGTPEPFALPGVPAGGKPPRMRLWLWNGEMPKN
jgi:hypothetical protein